MGLSKTNASLEGNPCGAWRVTVAAVGGLIVMLMLSGCGGMMGSSDSAYRFMREQQEKQAYLDKQEIKHWENRKPADLDMAVQMLVETQRQGRYFASLAYADAIQQQYGSSPQVLALRAEALRKTGQLDEATTLFESLTATPEAAQAWHGLGLIAGERSEYAQAAQYLHRAAVLLPTDADLQNDLGYAQLRQGQMGQARVSLGKAIELDAANPRILSNMALFLWASGREQDAEALMQQAGIGPQARAQITSVAADIQRETLKPEVAPTPLVSRLETPDQIAPAAALASADVVRRSDPQQVPAVASDEGRNRRFLDRRWQGDMRDQP